MENTMRNFVFAAAAIATVAAAPAMADTWTGAYVGGQIGYTDADNSDGESIGVHAGYNQQIGSMVYGGEMDFDWSNVEDTTFGVKQDNVSRLKGKVGYDFGNNVMAYATAGVAYNQTNIGSDTGYLYGAGVSYLTDTNWIVTGEVLKHEYSDFAGMGDTDDVNLSLRVSYKF